MRRSPMLLVKELPRSSSPSDGLCGGGVLRRKAELGAEVLVPEEGGSGAVAEQQCGGAEVDLGALAAQLHVHIGYDAVHGWCVQDVGDVEVGVVEVVLIQH